MLLKCFAPSNKQNHIDVADTFISLIESLSWFHPLKDQFLGESTLTKLFDIITEKGNETALKYGLSAVIKMVHLLSKADSESYTMHSPTDPLSNLPDLIRVILPNMDKLMDTYFKKDSTTRITSPSGQTIISFGFIRRYLMQLILDLLKLNYRAVTEEVLKKGWHVTAVLAVFAYDHNSFCHQLGEQIVDVVLEMPDSDISEFLKKTNLIGRIVELEEKNKKTPAAYYHCMAQFMNLANNKLEKLLDKKEKLNKEILGGPTGRAWAKLMREMHRLQRKLKNTEIPADKSQPRGKLVVADEDGISAEKPVETKPEPKPTRRKSGTRNIDLSTITDEELLKMDLDLDLNGLDDADSESLDNLLLETEEKDGGTNKDVLSRIEAILDGGLDTALKQ